MFGNRQFHRSFIIMKAWDTGYGLYEGKEPAGYCKMEIKNNNGRLQLYIQDMIPAETQHNIYDVALISNKEEIPPIKLTSIQIPEGGKGEFEITFEAEDVRQSGHDIGQYHALAVVDRPLKLDQALRFPLVGYSDKRVELNWTDDVSNELMGMYGLTRIPKKDSTKIQEQEHKKVKQNHVLQVQDESDDPLEEQEHFEEEMDIQEHQDHYEEEIDIQEHQDHYEEEIDIQQYQERFEEEMDIQKYQEHIEDTQEAEEDHQNLLIDILEDQHKEDQEDIPELESAQVSGEANFENSDEMEQSSYWHQVEGYYNSLFDKHKKVTPFDDAVAEVDWIRVDNRNEWSYPSYPIYPTFQHQAYPGYNPYRHDENQLDHYLVGMVRNLGKVEYVVYAIPGIYSAVPPMSMHGFSRWLPVKNAYGAGYWLLYIDVKTGNIAYPY